MRNDMETTSDASTLAKQLQNAAFNAGQEDASPVNAWTRQEKTAARSKAKLEELLAEIKRLEKNSARYELLRSLHWSDGALAVVVNPKEAVKLGHVCPSGPQLDAAIDELMNKEPPNE